MKLLIRKSVSYLETEEVAKLLFEKLNTKQISKTFEFVTKEEVSEEIENVIKHIDLNMKYFKNQFPSPCTNKGKYQMIQNTDWTNGFWTGILWLAFEYTEDNKYLNFAKRNVVSFEKRIKNKIFVDHHDLGFLYIPSVVSDYKITDNIKAKNTALIAAKQLLTRFQKKGGFIQAWGDMDSNDNYRLIIDSLMNIPLLYWAEEVSGDKVFGKIADAHYEKVIKTSIRSNGSTFHTYYFNKKTGLPLRGATRQGYCDDSSWARGQAWAIYGIPLHYKYRHQNTDLVTFSGVVNYFINRLPNDYVPYWDLIFKDGDGQPKDSSSGAIAVCGLAEMLKSLPETFPNKQNYVLFLHKMMRSLITNYSNNNFSFGAPLLDHGVYSWHSNKGVDEGNIWGDYFYLEALIRFYKDWEIFW